MKLQLNDGSYTRVSPEDYDYLVSLSNWGDDGKGYIRSSRLLDERAMHRIIASRMGLVIANKHVHHLDENPRNNQRGNLEVLTPSQHITGHNLSREWVSGESHGNSRLTDTEILSVIKSAMYAGWTQEEMAIELEYSKSHMKDLIKGYKRPDLFPKIQDIIKETGWVKGNVKNDTNEMLAIIQDFLTSGMTAITFCQNDGRISRQHLQNVLAGKRLPQLQDEINKLRKELGR